MTKIVLNFNFKLFVIVVRYSNILYNIYALKGGNGWVQARLLSFKGVKIPLKEVKWINGEVSCYIIVISTLFGRLRRGAVYAGLRLRLR